MFKFIHEDAEVIASPDQMAQYFPNAMVNWYAVQDDFLELLGITRVEVEVVPPTLEERRAQLYAQVAELREVEQAKGLVYPFADGLTGTVQTRNQQDLLNVNAQTTAAMVLQSQGVTAPVLVFRDDENVTHPMTPAQMLHMGMATSAFVSSTYTAKWRHDESIKVWDGTTDYDVTTGWAEAEEESKPPPYEVVPSPEPVEEPVEGEE